MPPFHTASTFRCLQQIFGTCATIPCLLQISSFLQKIPGILHFPAVLADMFELKKTHKRQRSLILDFFSPAEPAQPWQTADGNINSIRVVRVRVSNAGKWRSGWTFAPQTVRHDVDHVVPQSKIMTTVNEKKPQNVLQKQIRVSLAAPCFMAAAAPVCVCARARSCVCVRRPRQREQRLSYDRAGIHKENTSFHSLSSFLFISPLPPVSSSSSLLFLSSSSGPLAVWDPLIAT